MTSPMNESVINNLARVSPEVLFLGQDSGTDIGSPGPEFFLLAPAWQGAEAELKAVRACGAASRREDEAVARKEFVDG
jgi:hypothetical protein